jgi:hypothetical protein
MKMSKPITSAITEVSTKSLTEELQNRAGVTSFTVEPYEEIRIQTGHVERLIEGPVVVLINQD